MVYVIIQFGLLLLLGVFTDWTNINALVVSILLFAIALGIWSVLTVGLFNVSILPDIKNDIQLTVRGPYKIIRHPMYSSVLLFSCGLVLSNPAWYMILAFFFLFLDLIFKLRYEEKKLLEAFPEYSKYKNGTYYLVPFLY